MARKSERIPVVVNGFVESAHSVKFLAFMCAFGASNMYGGRTMEYISPAAI